jgi:hypothetical protein
MRRGHHPCRFTPDPGGWLVVHHPGAQLRRPGRQVGQPGLGAAPREGFLTSVDVIPGWT